MPDTQQENAKNLKNLGLKATGPRLKILEIFQERAKAGEDRHLSAEEVYKELVNTGEDVGLATVYRVLAQFASAGILTRRNFEHGTAVFELDDGHHHDHLICVMCGKVVEFVDEEVEKRQAEVAKQHGYELVDHSMALYGVCPECQKHKAEKRENLIFSPECTKRKDPRFLGSFLFFTEVNASAFLWHDPAFSE